jgi:putative ABC transport system permease protein
MLIKYIKIAFRNFRKHKTFSVINVLGLAMGISTCFLIYLYVAYELSYDTYHKNLERIYRVVNYNSTIPNHNYTSVPFAFGPALQDEYPEIKTVSRVWFRDFFVANGLARFQENIMYADSSLFSVFSFHVLTGNGGAALKEPFSVVISKSAEKKYFGGKNALGKHLELKNDFVKYNATVTGVIEDIPANSSFRSDIIVSMSTLSGKLEPGIDHQWTGPIGDTYILLTDEHSANTLSAKLPSFVKAHRDKLINEKSFMLELEPLKSVYLNGKYPARERGNINNVYAFSIIAAFILCLAAINFINLTTARAAERAKEVGILKIIGSSRPQLIARLLGDSLVLSFFAFVLSVLICSMLIPAFNDMAGKVITEEIIHHPKQLLLLFGFSLFIAIAAGLYPSYIISAFKPTDVIKGQFKTGKQGVMLRKILVVSQFTISTALIIGTIIVNQQLKYIRTQQLGFKKNEMLVIDFHRDQEVKRQLPVIKQQLTQLPNVLSAAASSGIPNSGFEPADYEIENKSGVMEHLAVPLYMVDEDFFNEYQIPMLAGRSFSKDFTTDFRESLIVNEAVATRLGFKDPKEILGKRFNGEGTGTIIGVVKNFHFLSLHESISPLIFRTFLPANRYITLSIKSGNVPETIKEVQNRWSQLVPGRPLEYFFLDEAISRQYKSEENFGKLFNYFGVLAILISCLGLFGLTLFSTYQRNKEIGIRKILGANTFTIIRMLSKDLLKLVLIAFFIAIPISWYAMRNWLQEFAYHININTGAFLTAGLLSLVIALLTVSFQSIRAAIANPVDSLRSE